MKTDKIDRLLEVCEAATGGTWHWEVDNTSHSVNLRAAINKGQLVMGFSRWGMQRAAPEFNRKPIGGPCIMSRVDKFLHPISGREHHKWESRIEHPDANYISTMNPSIVCSILTELKSAYAKIEELRAQRDEARREICELEHGWKDLTENEYAKHRDWDCYEKKDQ